MTRPFSRQFAGLENHIRAIASFSMLFLLVLVIWTLSSGALFAQGMASVTSGLGTDPDAPIEIESDQLDIYDEKQIAIFKGGVIAIQGATTLNSAILTVHYDGGTPGQAQSISRFEAGGGVKIIQADQNATGDNAYFDLINEVITITGNVVLSQGENVLRGSKLVVHMNTGEAQLFSEKLSGAKGGKSGRVQGLFIPNRAK